MSNNRSVCVRLVIIDNTSVWKVLIRKAIMRLCTIAVVTVPNDETKERFQKLRVTGFVGQGGGALLVYTSMDPDA